MPSSVEGGSARRTLESGECETGVARAATQSSDALSSDLGGQGQGLVALGKLVFSFASPREAF